MTVGDEDVFPSVVIEIEEFRAEPQEGNADGTNSRGPSHVGELAVVVIVVEIVSIVRKIGFDDVRPPVIVIVSGIDAHAGLFTAVRTVSHSSLGAHFTKTAFAVVVVKQAGGRIVGYVQVETAIFVVVQPKHA